MNTQVLYSTTGVSFIPVELISCLEGMVRYIYCSLKVYILSVKLNKNMFNLLFLLKNILIHTHTHKESLSYSRNVLCQDAVSCVRCGRL